MNEDHEHRARMAEQLGRTQFFTSQLVALAQLGNDAPAAFLRKRLKELAEQATSHDLVTPEEVAEDLANLRRAVEWWKYEQHIRPKKKGGDR